MAFELHYVHIACAVYVTDTHSMYNEDTIEPGGEVTGAFREEKLFSAGKRGDAASWNAQESIVERKKLLQSRGVKEKGAHIKRRCEERPYGK